MNRNSDLASKIYAIFIAVIKCFILACGISLLLFSFMIMSWNLQR